MRVAALLLSCLALALGALALDSREAEAQAYTTVDHAIDTVGLPPVFHDIAYLESGDDPYAVNPYSGACGWAQLLPSTAAAYGYSCYDMMNPYVAAEAARLLYYDYGLSPWAASLY